MKDRPPRPPTRAPADAARPRKAAAVCPSKKFSSIYIYKMPKNKKRKSASSRRNRRSQKGSKPPSGYVCHLCGKPGHWKNQCTLAPFPPFYSPAPGTLIKAPTTAPYTHTHAPATLLGDPAVYGWTEAEADAAAALAEVVGRPSYVHGQPTAGRGARRPAAGRGVKFPGEHKLVHGWTVKQAKDAARRARHNPAAASRRRRGAHMRDFLARYGGRRRKTRKGRRKTRRTRRRTRRGRRRRRTRKQRGGVCAACLAPLLLL